MPKIKVRCGDAMSSVRRSWMLWAILLSVLVGARVLSRWLLTGTEVPTMYWVVGSLFFVVPIGWWLVIERIHTRLLVREAGSNDYLILRGRIGEYRSLMEPSEILPGLTPGQIDLLRRSLIMSIDDQLVIEVVGQGIKSRIARFEIPAHGLMTLWVDDDRVTSVELAVDGPPATFLAKGRLPIFARH